MKPHPFARLARVSVALSVAAAISASAVSAADFHADFSAAPDGPPPDEWFAYGAWSVSKGALESADPRRATAAPADIPYGRSVRIEAMVTPVAATGADWKQIGIAVYWDARNYWLLSLTEFPGRMDSAKHLIELNAMVDGEWQAQTRPGPAELPLWGEPFQRGTWRSGETYRLSLELTAEGVRATVEDAAGNPVYARGHRFTAEARAVREGVPLLWSLGYQTRFHSVSASVANPVEAPEGALNVRAPIPPPRVSADGAGWAFRADFEGAAEEAAVEAPWHVSSRYWETRRGALRAADPGRVHATIAGAPEGSPVRIEADIRVEQSLGGSWKQAGLAVVSADDPKRYWLLCLTEEPGNHAGAKHLFELSEMLPPNNWQAQNKEGPTRLETVEARAFSPWSRNTRYRLRLELTSELVEGTVFGAHGETVFHALYKATGTTREGDMVRRGTPVLWSQGFDCSFDNVEMAVRDVAPAGAQVPWTQAASREDYDTPYKARPYTAAPMGERIAAEAPGFFGVTERDGVTWLVDPNGYRYFSVGVEQVKYSGHFSPALGYSPYNRAIMAKYDGSIQKWADATSARLREWGFNTASVMPYAVAPGGGEAFLDGIAVTMIVNLGQSFVPYSDLSPVTINGFPNVFHPRWQEHCDAKAREFCARFRDNPWILGYYIDNELDWHGSNCAAFFIHTKGEGPQEYGLILDILRKPRDHSARIAFLGFLRGRYDGIGALNAAWGTSFAGFDEIDADGVFRFGAPVAGSENDMREFLRVIADRYYGATSSAIRKADPNHLILGTRFAGWSQDPVWEMCGKYCDVVSVNHYPFVELDEGTVRSAREMLRHVVTLCHRPILLSEWSFVSLDSGLPCRHGAGERFDTEEQRARAFQIYQSMLFETPFCVGSDYFMWVDEPCGGMASASNPEDCSYGLVNENDDPYETLVAAASEINRAAVALHGGAVPSLGFSGDGLVVSNRCERPCSAAVELWVDGERRDVAVSLDSGAARRIALPPGKSACRAARARVEGLPETDGQSAWTVDLQVAPGSVAVANPTGRPIRNHVAEFPLKPGGQVRAVAADGNMPPQQIEERDGARTLVVLVESLPPHSAAVFTLEEDASAAILVPQPLRLPLALDNGVLSARKGKADGWIFDEVAAGGLAIGAIHPLLWEKTPQNQFVRPAQLLSLMGIDGPARTTLDYDFALADASAAQKIPEISRDGRPVQPAGVPSAVGAFRLWCRVVLPRGVPYFTVQFRGVENLADFGWTLDRYFHYMPSRLGGDMEGDEPLGSVLVTEYYDPQLLWFDSGARAGYGVVRPRSFFGSSFYVDPEGNQHPDLCRTVRVRLEPGESWKTDSEPAVPVFACLGDLADRPWEDVARDIRTRSSVILVKP